MCRIIHGDLQPDLGPTDCVSCLQTYRADNIGKLIQRNGAGYNPDNVEAKTPNHWVFGSGLVVIVVDDHDSTDEKNETEHLSLDGSPSEATCFGHVW